MQKRIWLGVMVALLFIGTTPVAAHPGHAEHDGMAASGRTVAEQGQDDAAAFRVRGQELLMQLKKDRQEKTQQQRQESCQAHQRGLQTKIDKLAAAVQQHKTRIDGVLAKVTAYQQAHNLNVGNYETLVTSATAAQATAASSVAAFDSLKPSVDCSSENIAPDVAAFRAAATQARSDLSEYRQAVKALLRAVQAAKSEGDRS
jgi:chromosome segregation ATPase